MAVTNPPVFIQAGGEQAEQARRLITALLGGIGPGASGSQGIVRAGDLAVSQTPTPSMAVQIAAGMAFVAGTHQATQGIYFVESRQVETRAIPPADPANPRKDLVVARVRDAAYAGTQTSWDLEVVSGTPAPTPSEPAVPANSLVLALVDVPAGATSITDSQITDRRTSQAGQLVRATALGGVAVGEQLESATTLLGERGRLAVRSSSLELLIANGTAWQFPRNLVGFKQGSEFGKLVMTGTVNVTVLSGQSTGTTTFSWPVAFAAAPRVWLTIQGATGARLMVAIANPPPTATQCSVTVGRADGTTVTTDATITVAWLAVG